MFEKKADPGGAIFVGILLIVVVPLLTGMCSVAYPQESNRILTKEQSPAVQAINTALENVDAAIVEATVTRDYFVAQLAAPTFNTAKIEEKSHAHMAKITAADEKWRIASELLQETAENAPHAFKSIEQLWATRDRLQAARDRITALGEDALKALDRSASRLQRQLER